MSFAPQVNIIKFGDRLTVLVHQKYYPRGIISGRCPTCGENSKHAKVGYRWVYANWFSLEELERIEKEPYKQDE